MPGKIIEARLIPLKSKEESALTRTIQVRRQNSGHDEKEETINSWLPKNFNVVSAQEQKTLDYFEHKLASAGAGRALSVMPGSDLKSPKPITSPKPTKQTPVKNSAKPMSPTDTDQGYTTIQFDFTAPSPQKTSNVSPSLALIPHVPVNSAITLSQTSTALPSAAASPFKRSASLYLPSTRK